MQNSSKIFLLFVLHGSIELEKLSKNMSKKKFPRLDITSKNGLF